jgi:hypothetical protein
MTKNQFREAAIKTGQVFWVKYSGKIKTFYVCCKNSHVIEGLQELAEGSHFKVKFG